MANKLRASHINFENCKMKVDLAAQTLSASVASALKYCREELNFNEFEGSEPTERFLNIIDRLFDIMNSRFNS